MWDEGFDYCSKAFVVSGRFLGCRLKCIRTPTDFWTSHRNLHEGVEE